MISLPAGFPAPGGQARPELGELASLIFSIPYSIAKIDRYSLLGSLL
jgi:hypothetical protein